MGGVGRPLRHGRATGNGCQRLSMKTLFAFCSSVCSQRLRLPQPPGQAGKRGRGLKGKQVDARGDHGAGHGRGAGRRAA